MAERSFTVQSAFSFAILKISHEWRFLLSVAIIFGLVVYLPVAMQSVFENRAGHAGIVPSIIIGVSFPAQMLLGMGLIYIALRMHDGLSSRVQDVVAPYLLFFDYVVSSLVYLLIVLAGILLLIVPGIYWAVRFQFYSFIIIDEQLGPIKALKKSYALTENQFWGIVWFNLAIALVSLASAIIIAIGPIVAAIFTSLATAHVYRRLIKELKKRDWSARNSDRRLR